MEVMAGKLLILSAYRSTTTRIHGVMRYVKCGPWAAFPIKGCAFNAPTVRQGGFSGSKSVMVSKDECLADRGFYSSPSRSYALGNMGPY
jgi:hypothetical protein